LIWTAAVAALVLSLLLMPVAFLQLLYLAALRLRTRDTAALEWFRETLEPRLGLKLEEGALIFSVAKHSLLVLLALAFLVLMSGGEALSWRALAEGFALSWVAMMALAHIVPHLLIRKTSGKLLLPLVPLFFAMAAASKPLVGTLTFLQSLAELNEPEEAKEEASNAAEEIEALIEAGKEEGIIEEGDSKLIQSVVEFGDKTVREVMTPRPNIVAVSGEATLEELRSLIIREQYSRVPVYEESIDHVTGFIHVRDVFEVEYSERTRRRVREIARPVKYVPETKPVGDLLREMQHEGSHMVMVADEYGNTAGLVTMEDLVEEILGEIRDEYEPEHDVAGDAETGYRMSGNLDVDRLADLFGFRPPEGTESTTVGGMLTEWLGRVPQKGERVERDGLSIEVLEADERRVSQVHVARLAPGLAADGESIGEQAANGQKAQA
jgi:CBS domain containing-hemolysin-like protein